MLSNILTLDMRINLGARLIMAWAIAASTVARTANSADNGALMHPEMWQHALPRLEMLDPPLPLPQGLTFEDSQGQSVTLAATNGELRLINLWATWCAPCREEMPALDRLAEHLLEEPFQVLAIASGPHSMANIKRFYTSADLKHLEIYQSPDSQLAARLGAIALPSSFIVSPNGLVLARLIGDADWDAPAVIAVIRDHLPN